MNKLILLDTDVLQALVNKKKKDSVKSVLKVLKKVSKDYSFGITYFTKYEFLRGLTPKSKLEFRAKLLNQFRYFYPQEAHYELARILFTIYKKLGIQKPDEGDIMLAAANLQLKNSMILTINKKDYPREIFKEYMYYPIIDNQKYYVGQLFILKNKKDIVFKIYESIMENKSI